MTKTTTKRLLPALLLFFMLFSTCFAWEWSDFLSTSSLFKSTNTLTMKQVEEMRVRDIKRRLARTHGYGADELGRMLDKKELIHALAFEEHKIRQGENQEMKRALFIQATIFTILAGALVLFWPLLQHVWDVAHVNFVVYTDRKILEARKCWELRSVYGSLGVVCMFLVDLLQIWLTLSVILSWIMTSKYFFPIPSLPIRPAAMMGGEVSNGPLARYGINVGPMIITWVLRFLQGRLETWTGRALSNARRAQSQQSKKQRRANETPQEREARRAARRARKAARKQQEEQRQTEVQQEFSRHQDENATSSRPDDNAQQDDHGGIDEKFPTFNDLEPSIDEKRSAAAAAAEARSTRQEPVVEETFTALDELD